MISTLQTPPMTPALWGLVIFILWIIAVVVGLITVRIRHLSAGGSPKDFGTPDDASLLWRLFRVQSNLVENLPLYLGVVLLLTVRGVSGIEVNGLVGVYIGARLVHSGIHIAGLNPIFRVVCLGIQFICLMVLTVLAVF
ncbi:MAG: MAPEG family protein [Oscillatoriales cyanobacterium RM2_1_1]|nr:MAPEG family protein [Oscillatoriales cyanobacterium SM2_3_0]NJO45254.1 MAPEG family protein [Oscillatoriales cyanobacterium RM2_1_1]